MSQDMWGLLRVVSLCSCVGDYLLARDVPEFEFECWRNPTILGKSEIQWIYRLVCVRFRPTVHCIKLSFIIYCRPLFATQK